MFIILNPFFIISLFAIYSNADPEPELAMKSLFLLANTSFTQHIIFGSDEKLKSCELSLIKENTTNILSGILDINKEVTFMHDENITSLGRGLCGYKHIYYQDNKYLDNQFNLSAEYSEYGHDIQTNFLFTVSVYAKLVMSDVDFVFKFGKPGEIKYGGNMGKKTLRLYNPEGKLVKYEENILRERSKFEIDYVTLDHIGTWVAEVGVEQTMDPQFQYIEVNVTDYEQVVQWYNEDDGYGILGCRVENQVSTIISQSCKFEGPNGVPINSDDRYTFNGTNTRENTCQVEFELPIQENEIGYWKCIIHFSGSSSGALIPVGTNLTDPFEEYIEKYVNMTQSHNLICKVTFSSDNCIIISPSGKTYIGGNVHDFSLGECKTKISSVHAEHIGTWTCVFSNPNELEDVIVTYELKENIIQEQEIIGQAIGIDT